MVLDDYLEQDFPLKTIVEDTWVTPQFLLLSANRNESWKAEINSFL
jgi:hypothetical protein